MTEALLSIPLSVINLRDKDFLNFIEQFSGETVKEYFECLGVRSVDSFLVIDNIFAPLQEDYLELVGTKNKLGFRHSDGSYVIKIGEQHDVNKLIKSLRNLVINKAQVISDLANSNELIFKSDVFQQHTLKRLIDFYNNLLQKHGTTN